MKVKSDKELIFSLPSPSNCLDSAQKSIVTETNTVLSSEQIAFVGHLSLLEFYDLTQSFASSGLKRYGEAQATYSQHRKFDPKYENML